MEDLPLTVAVSAIEHACVLDTAYAVGDVEVWPVDTEGLLDAGAAELPVWRRRDLPPGFAVAGPAVIEEQSSSIVIGAGETARVDSAFNLVVEL